MLLPPRAAKKLIAKNATIIRGVEVYKDRREAGASRRDGNLEDLGSTVMVSLRS
jgi:hypothetical protein